MSGPSSIEWTDATWNPTRGCTKISPGCKHCYAETFAERFRGVAGHPYEQGFDPREVPSHLGDPLLWSEPRRIFVNSMSDLFHGDFSDTFVGAVMGVSAVARQHVLQILTKRPEHARTWFGRGGRTVRDCVEAAFGILSQIDPSTRAIARAEAAMWDALQGTLPGWPLPNVWIGTSVESADYRWRLDELREIPAAVRFVSLEPLLADPGEIDLTGIGWVIVGGESGPRARPFAVEWARSIVAQCRAAGVAVFVKQLGAKPVTIGDPTGNFRTDPETGNRQYEIATTRLALRSRKGGDPEEWPEDLRIREFPRVEGGGV